MDDDALLGGDGASLEDTALIALELHHALGTIGAPLRLMSIVASWMITRDDNSTLALLRQFNASHINTDPNLH